MKAIISGAGISGLTLGRCLADDGWHVIIIERAHGLRDEGYMIDFFGSGFDVAERLGLLPRLREVSYTVHEVDFVDESGKAEASVSYDAFRKVLKGKLLSLMRGDLERTLFETLPENVHIRYGCSIASIENGENGVRVTLDDGTAIDADLLAGADGIHSVVREKVFGPEKDFLRDLDLRVGVYMFRDAQIHARLASSFPLMTVPKRTMGLFADRGGRVMAFFVHAGHETVPSADAVGILRAHFGDLGWLVPGVLSHAADGAIYYDAVAQIEMAHWQKDRVVLLGDACAAVSLLAGQGASLGMAMAYVIAEEIRKSGSVSKGLVRYEKRLQRALAAKQKAGRNTASSFVPMTERQVRVRNFFLKLARLPLLSGFLNRLFLSGSDSVIR
ncbi:MAG TPA: FAD-dependent monooxygenase [Rhizomicrobium sp.]|jgi:2-polyprenyl-6-methoxyphenol hydroxylase-like FAD-dependent oxidoreductase|nr:FAD-dependent monooxygenase [Rhizomicrobium sp.]